MSERTSDRAALPRSLPGGHWLGVEVRWHYSALLAAVLGVLTLRWHFVILYPGWSSAAVWTTAGGIAIAFLLGAALNAATQLFVMHAGVARGGTLTVCMFGGLATTPDRRHDARAEFWVGVASPMINAFAGVLCLALASLWHTSPARIPGTPWQAGLIWAGYVNLRLAGLNLLPAFPLGGGRVVRAVAWRVLRDEQRSLLVAVRVAQPCAWGGLCLGLFWLLGPRGLAGFWIALAAWVVLETATLVLRQDPRGPVALRRP